MKARYNITGEIVDIEDMSTVTYKESDGTYVKTLIKNFTFIDAEKDYYTKLEHQYAGMAMQGILSNPQIWKDWNEEGLVTKDLEAADMADYFATALVEKLKSGSNEKTMHRLSTQS